MGAFTYPRSEPGSAGHQDLVERLNVFVAELRREVEGLSEDVLARRPAQGDWSIKEVCGHLCDHAKHLHTRLFRIIKQEEPRLPAWDQEEAIRERDPQGATLDDLLADFSRQRGETVEMLADLVHWNWARQGRHEELGRISIRQLVDRAIAHDENHLEQIRRLKPA
ncbi:MAG: DinB family protein [Dehalococcoidia bacterium]|nr:DinB family protein [Dehalococcoidia bacterium]